MSEIWSRRGKFSPAEIGRSLSRMVQVELAEARQSHDLAIKHGDMLDLIDRDYLGANEATMDYRLPDGLSLAAVRSYLEDDDSYPELRSRVYANLENSSNSTVADSQRDSRRGSRAAFIDGARSLAGDSHSSRWQILFNLVVMGALRDADLSDDHRQILGQTYIETKAMVADHLPRLSRQLILRDYPFVHPTKGWSPFERI